MSLQFDTPRAGYASCCAALATTDLCSALSSIAAPILVIAGREDPATDGPRAEPNGDQRGGAIGSRAWERVRAVRDRVRTNASSDASR